MANLGDFQDRRVLLPVTIANGTSLSPPFDTGGMCIIGISMPAVWTAAALSFQTAVDNVTWQELKGQGDSAVSIAVSQGNNYWLPSSTDLSGSPPETVFGAFRYFKVRSGTVGIPVNQSQQSIITFVLYPMP